MGTEELSHNCGGSFAYTEMFRMSSAQLQSIKNALNTHKVSLATHTASRNVEAYSPVASGQLFITAEFERWLRGCLPQDVTPLGLPDSACSVHH